MVSGLFYKEQDLITVCLFIINSSGQQTTKISNTNINKIQNVLQLGQHNCINIHNALKWALNFLAANVLGKKPGFGHLKEGLSV